MATLEQEAQPGAQGQSGPVTTGAARRRRIVTLLLVLGILAVCAAGAYAGISIRSAIARQRTISRFTAQVTAHDAAVARHDRALSTAQRSLDRVSAAGAGMSKAQEALDHALDVTNQRVNSCSSARCFDSLNVANARAASAFGRKMRGTSVPAGASALARRLASGTSAYRKSWTYMSRATSLTDVEKRARISETTESRFYSDDNALARWLKDRAGALQQQETALDRQGAALNRSGDALRLRGAALGVRADVRTARTSAPGPARGPTRTSREPLTSAA